MAFGTLFGWFDDTIDYIINIFVVDISMRFIYYLILISSFYLLYSLCTCIIVVQITMYQSVFLQVWQQNLDVTDRVENEIIAFMWQTNLIVCYPFLILAYVSISKNPSKMQHSLCGSWFGLMIEIDFLPMLRLLYLFLTSIPPSIFSKAMA